MRRYRFETEAAGRSAVSVVELKIVSVASDRAQMRLALLEADGPAYWVEAYREQPLDLIVDRAGYPVAIPGWGEARRRLAASMRRHGAGDPWADAEAQHTEVISDQDAVYSVFREPFLIGSMQGWEMPPATNRRELFRDKDSAWHFRDVDEITAMDGKAREMQLKRTETVQRRNPDPMSGHDPRERHEYVAAISLDDGWVNRLTYVSKIDQVNVIRYPETVRVERFSAS